MPVIRIGELSRDTTKRGKARTTAKIVGSEFYVFHVAGRPTLYDPRFMKTVRIHRAGVYVVRVYREDQVAPTCWHSGYLAR